MSTHRFIDAVCVLVTVLALVLTVLFMNGERLGIAVLVDEDTDAHASSLYFTANDLNGSWDTAGSTQILLRGDDAVVRGAGAYAYNGDVYITSTGRFIVSGALTDGQIIVDAHKNAKVWILLNGADIYCSDNAALYIEQADKVFLTLADGTENTLASGAEYSAEAQENRVKGAVFTRDDLTVNGTGALTISALYRHGIDANDDLVITGGSITIDAVRDAIHVNDSLRICNAALTLSGRDEAIDVDADGGFFYMTSGSVRTDSTDDGINARGDILITGGELSVRTGDDGIHSGGTVYIYGGDIRIEECCEGIEGIAVELHGGNVDITCADDGVNANGSLLNGAYTLSGASGNLSTYVLISGGNLSIVNTLGEGADGIDSNGDILVKGGSVFISVPDGSALDYAVEAGGRAVIDGGTVLACGSYSTACSFGDDSQQGSVLYNIRRGMPEGTALSLLDGDGNVILRRTVPNAFSSAVLSVPGMSPGERYTILCADGREDLTLEEMSAAFGDVQSSLYAGTMHWGGLQPVGGFGAAYGEEDTSDVFPEGADHAPDELPDIRPKASVEAHGSVYEPSTDRETVASLTALSAGVLLLGLGFAAVFRKKIDL